MPYVPNKGGGGGQHFSYSPKGVQAARKKAAATGQPMKMSGPPKKAAPKKSK